MNQHKWIPRVYVVVWEEHRDEWEVVYAGTSLEAAAAKARPLEECTVMAWDDGTLAWGQWTRFGKTLHKDPLDIAEYRRLVELGEIADS